MTTIASKLITVKDILTIDVPFIDSLPVSAYARSTLLSLAEARGLYKKNVGNEIDIVSDKFTSLLSQQLRKNGWQQEQLEGTSTLNLRLTPSQSLSHFLTLQVMQPLQKDLQQLFQTLKQLDNSNDEALEKLFKLLDFWWFNINKLTSTSSEKEELQFFLASLSNKAGSIVLNISAYSIQSVKKLERWQSLLELTKGKFQVKNCNMQFSLVKNMNQVLKDSTPALQGHLDLIKTELIQLLES